MTARRSSGPTARRRRPTSSHPYIQTARPGARAPHVWLDDGRSTLDLYGRGFVLLRLGQRPPSGISIEQAAQQRGVPLTSIAIDDAKVLAAYERKLVLVQPDGPSPGAATKSPPTPAC